MPETQIPAPGYDRYWTMILHLTPSSPHSSALLTPPHSPSPLLPFLTPSHPSSPSSPLLPFLTPPYSLSPFLTPPHSLSPLLPFITPPHSLSPLLPSLTPSHPSSSLLTPSSPLLDLEAQLTESTARVKLIVTDGVFSMDGEIDQLFLQTNKINIKNT